MSFHGKMTWKITSLEIFQFNFNSQQEIVLPDTSQLIAPAGAQEVILSVRVCVSSLLKLYALSQQALSQLLELKLLGLVF